MNNFLRLVNNAAGVMLILAGLALANIELIQIPFEPDSDSFRLIQIHFILVGLISVWTSSKSGPASIKASLGMLNAGFNAWIAVRALASGDPGLYWTLIFFAVSALNLLLVFRSDGEDGAKEEGDDAAPGEIASVDQIDPKFGVAESHNLFQSAFINTVVLVLSYCAMFGLLFFGAVYASLLLQVLFDDAIISFAKLFENIKNGKGNDAFFEIGIYVVVITVVYGFIYFFEAFIRSVAQGRARDGNVDVDREFTDKERHFLRDSLNELLRYLESKDYPPKWKILYYVGVASVIIGLAVTPLLVWLLEFLIGDLLTAHRLSDADPLLYSGPWYVGGAIAGFFLGSLIPWTIYQRMGRRMPEFGEYLFAEAGWNSMNNRARTPDELFSVLTRHVRLRYIDTEQLFDPPAFLTAAFREYEGLIYKLTLFFSALTLILSAADLARFELVDERGVTYSKYFHFVQNNVGLADLDRIELRCMIFTPDDGGENLVLEYILVKENEFRIDLITDETKENKIDQLAALNARITEMGVSVIRAESPGFLRGDRSTFVPNCAEEIAERYSPADSEKLITLLHVPEFASQE